MKKIVSIIMLLHAVAAFSQGEANIWYFGYKGGLDFNSGAPVALTDGALFTDEGCAVLSNSEGQLQFYTDGVTVYNKNHQVMENGNDLIGSYTSSQSATIVQKPGSLNLFYIFTTGMQDMGQLACSVVDMYANNGLGKVTETKNIILLPSSTEQCTVIPHSNGTDMWIIAHGYANNTFYSFLLTEDGVNNPISTNIGFEMAQGGSPTGAIGILKSSPNGNKVVLTGNESGVQLFDFNAATGVLSNVQTLAEGIFFYGAEFSSSGNVLYISHSLPNLIVQFDLTANDIPEAWEIVAEDIEQQVGALQLGPDGKIYFVLSNLNSLSVINNPEVIGTGCNVDYYTVPLAIGTAFYGLPNFAPSIFKQRINSEEYCLGEATQFNTGPGAPDSVAWNFGDGTTSQEITPQHTFTAAGTYTVTATINFLGIPKILTHKVVITVAPQFTLGGPYTACAANQVTLAAQDTDFDTAQATYVWEQNGQTVGNTATLHPEQFGTYTLIVTVNGCSTTQTAEVTQKTVTATFAEGCINNSYTLGATPAEDSFDAATATYAWAGPNGFTANGSETVISATGEYTVTITTAGGCVITHTWNVEQTNPPQFTLGGPYSACVASQLELAPAAQNFDPAQAAYLWVFNGQTVGNTATLHPEQFGTYILTVTVNGCKTTQSIEVTQSVITAIFTEGCVNNSYTLGTAPAEDSFDAATATYVWTGPNGFTATGPEAIITLTGEYVLTITTADGCSITHNWDVTATDCPDQMIPRGVSPNDDGKNDTFDLSLHDVAKLDIFNRYGLLVFSRGNYTTQWHGQADDGEILPTGTYYYCIHKRNGKDITGWVYVNR